MLAERSPNGSGFISCTPQESEAVKGWWYHEAEEKIKKEVKDLKIPWDDLAVTQADIEEGNLVKLSGTLAQISTFSVKINQRLAIHQARLVASKEALEHAVARNLARPQDEGPKLSIAARTALNISQTTPLRHAKIATIEAAAFVKALETTRDSLDILWRTCSRVISARLREPID